MRACVRFVMGMVIAVSEVAWGLHGCMRTGFLPLSPTCVLLSLFPSDAL